MGRAIAKESVEDKLLVRVQACSSDAKMQKDSLDVLPNPTLRCESFVGQRLHKVWLIISNDTI